MKKYTREEDKALETYVRQFEDRYKVRRGEDGIQEIVCAHGDIEPYSTTELCCFQAFKSQRGINNLKRRLPAYCTATQEGNEDLVFKFPNAHLDEIAEMVEARKRRHLSEEQKRVGAERFRILRESQKRAVECSTGA